MRIDVLTLFPEMFTGVVNSSILQRAINENHLEINIIDYRKFSLDKNYKVDDYPYGGGAGMVIEVEPIVLALRSIPKGYTVLTSPKGVTYNQDKAKELSKKDHLIIVCGHYEGIDNRITNYIDEEISIGDYILTGGEIAALAMIDSIARLIPNVLGNQESLQSESFEELLEYPQYTRPEEFEGLKVPSVLLSGHHENVRKWRRFQSLKKTYERRQDILEKANLTKEDLKFLDLIKEGKDLEF
ncbi:MAG TPA: tRNA (guanosine(37)-N1)-methyltransferase TrmD [Acholeplasma sp.]|nr:tRNA (guanosine(37)-N1)-methyltransferase TrmD [Acholeplasma sp.]